MKIEGDHLFAARREIVFEALLDPEVLSRTLPGFESLERVGENAFQGALSIRVGPVQGQFQGKVELSDLRPPESYQLKMSGQGASGFLNGEGSIRLDEEGSSTRLHYDVDAQVGGRIAGVGQRLLDSSGKVLTRQALEGLERQIAARRGGAAEGEARAETTGAQRQPPPPPEAPSQVRFAARMARGVAADLVPAERRPLVFGIALVLYTVVVVLVTRACGG